MLCRRLCLHLVSIGYLVFVALCASPPRAVGDDALDKLESKGTSVLILGGGVSGIIAARTLNENGITNFRIIEARGELGGRLRSTPFGAPGKQKTIEVLPPPPNWSH